MGGFVTGHRSLRRGRESIAGQLYLVTTTTRGRNPLFRDWQAARVACRTIVEAAGAVDLELLCWVLMPDHWHGLLRVGEAASLSHAMNCLKGRSAIAVNRALRVNGRVWSRGFHDHALRRDEHAIVVARYVIANPVRAGLVTSVRNYPFWDAAWLASADRSPASGLLHAIP